MVHFQAEPVFSRLRSVRARSRTSTTFSQQRISVSACLARCKPRADVVEVSQLVLNLCAAAVKQACETSIATRLFVLDGALHYIAF